MERALTLFCCAACRHSRSWRMPFYLADTGRARLLATIIVRPRSTIGILHCDRAWRGKPHRTTLNFSTRAALARGDADSLFQHDLRFAHRAAGRPNLICGTGVAQPTTPCPQPAPPRALRAGAAYCGARSMRLPCLGCDDVRWATASRCKHCLRLSASSSAALQSLLGRRDFRLRPASRRRFSVAARCFAHRGNHGAM